MTAVPTRPREVASAWIGRAIPDGDAFLRQGVPRREGAGSDVAAASD